MLQFAPLAPFVQYEHIPSIAPLHLHTYRAHMQHVCKYVLACTHLQVPLLVQILWDSLLDLDDLSSSTNSIMELMCTLLSSSAPHQQNSTPVQSNLHNLVPRLWPFLSHTISSVRRSSLRALLMLLKLDREAPPPGGSGLSGPVTAIAEQGEEVKVQVMGEWWLKGNLLRSLLCQVFQRLALEGVAENRELLHQVGIIWSERALHRITVHYETRCGLMQCATPLLKTCLLLHLLLSQLGCVFL